MSTKKEMKQTPILRKKKFFNCGGNRKKSGSSSKKPCPLCIQMYFQPYSSKSLKVASTYGSDYNGVNLFGVYFWGLVFTYANEGIYVMISHTLKSQTQTFSFAQDDPKWEFTDLNYKDCSQLYFLIWGIISLVYLVISFIRFRCLKDSKDKNDFVGRTFTTMLLILTFIPAALAGSAWENELTLLRSNDPEQYFDYDGWIVLIIVPLLWPIVCSCFVIVFALLGSFYACVCIKKTRSTYDDDDDAYEDDEEDYSSDYEE